MSDESRTRHGRPAVRRGDGVAPGLLPEQHLGNKLHARQQPADHERIGIHVRTNDRWCWWLCNAALSCEMDRHLEGTIEGDELDHTAGNQGQATQGGKRHLGRRPRRRRKKREPGRGHDDKDRPALIARVSRQGAVVVQAVRDCTVSTVQTAADFAVKGEGVYRPALVLDRGTDPGMD